MNDFMNSVLKSKIPAACPARLHGNHVVAVLDRRRWKGDVIAWHGPPHDAAANFAPAAGFGLLLHEALLCLCLSVDDASYRADSCDLGLPRSEMIMGFMTAAWAMETNVVRVGLLCHGRWVRCRCEKLPVARDLDMSCLLGRAVGDWTLGKMPPVMPLARS
ncbi:hypothetical protein ACLOJK_036951 [Asimina triloba]